MLSEDASSPRRWGQKLQGPILEGLHFHLVSLYGCSCLWDQCRAVIQPLWFHPISMYQGATARLCWGEEGLQQIC